MPVSYTHLVIVQTLFNISRKAAGVGLYLEYGVYLRALQRQPSCHNHADVAGAQDDGPPADHFILQVDIGPVSYTHLAEALPCVADEILDVVIIGIIAGKSRSFLAVWAADLIYDAFLQRVQHRCV